MLELFANPLNMAFGAALVSSPIIIHLINRMRFRRVRWAAMEFLLKSQKRNQRRLIIEQLILLLLRILLVLLAGLLLARFLGFAFAGFGPQNGLHFVLLDDRLSMTDQWKSEEGDRKNAFDVAKQSAVREVAKNALLNRSFQRLVVRRLSEPTRDLFDARLSEDALKELTSTLAQAENCSQLHLDLYRGVEAAREVFDRNATDRRTLYVLSDFRQRHWFEPEATGLLKALDSLAQTGVKVHFLDCADPRRTDTQKVPLYHDNLAVTELRPETRVAAQNSLVQFKVAVANHGASERKGVRVTIKVNGSERAEASQTIQSLPPNKVTEATFLASFDQIGFNQVTANLENEEFGLPGDNVRYAVIEVRKQVPVLVIDGDLAGGDKAGGDTFHLRTLFNAAKGFEVVRGGVAELERPNLDQFAGIYLLNVRELNTEKQLQNLEEYVRGGGGVAFFVGDRLTSVDYYNRKLYADGKGLFPAPLANQPTKALTDEERQERALQNLLDPQFQLFVRDDTHPIFKNTELDKYRVAFKFLNIERYVPVPRQRWQPEPGRVQELMTLPNTRPMTDYEGTALELLKELPVDDPRYAKYKPGLERHRTQVREKLAGKSLAALSAAFDALLHDRGNPTDPDRPNLEEFWDLPESAVSRLRARIDRFRETVQLGDPLMIAAEYGKGRVVAVLTTAGTKWNDWAGGSPASFTYPVIMLEMQKYLSSLGDEGNLTVGTPKQFEVEANRYEPEMRTYYLPERQDGQAVKPGEGVPGSERGKQSGSEARGRLGFVFDGARKPGVYFFELVQRPTEMTGQGRVETRAYAFNVDADNESDLRRSSKTDLEKVAGGAVKVQSAGAGFDDQADRRSDLSESGWLYLAFLIILLIEQALAVHLSFHLKDNVAQLPAQAVRPQPTAA